jgi:hypothetical protein
LTIVVGRKPRVFCVPLLLLIMVCNKMIILRFHYHLCVFITRVLLSKTTIKGCARRLGGGVHLKQLVDKTQNNTKSCDIIMVPLLTWPLKGSNMGWSLHQPYVRPWSYMLNNRKKWECKMTKGERIHLKLVVVKAYNNFRSCKTTTTYTCKIPKQKGATWGEFTTTYYARPL